MIYRFLLLALLLCSFYLPANASELLSYDTYSLKSFSRIQLLVPKDPNQDRVYIKTRFRKQVIKAFARIDNQTLVQAIGTTQTTSVPAELAQKFGSNFIEVIAFPENPLKSAKKTIVFALQTDDGKETRITLHGKRLSKVVENLH